MSLLFGTFCSSHILRETRLSDFAVHMRYIRTLWRIIVSYAVGYAVLKRFLQLVVL